MTDNELIERIVQEVIRRLSASGIAGASVSVGSADRELVLKDKLITLATLKGRLTDVRRVVVPRRAVVTPAVRDELKKNNVALSVEDRR